MEYTHWWGPHLHWFWVAPFLVMVLMFAFLAHMVRRAAYLKDQLSNLEYVYQ